MYFLDNWHKFLIAALLIAAYGVGTSLYSTSTQIEKTETAVSAMNDHTGRTAQTMQMQHVITNNAYALGWLLVGVTIFLIFLGDLRRLLTSANASMLLVGFLIFGGTGCSMGRKPFEPIKLEVIKSNEEAFMLPLTGDNKKQGQSDNEEYLKSNLVYTKQVQIPQQWVAKGYETTAWNGEWRDAALLIKVDKSPVTREWTADPNSGTSNKNEAIWVMTSDQVEFSTGWTITARIAGREDAIKFLHNYPNGSLTTVLDTEVRSKLQAVFGLAVTDLPMDELRKAATPHLNKTTKDVSDFFKTRGITITNLGISGGFIYRDKSIIETMVKVFNAEQEKAVALANTNAQRERNNAVILKSQGEADAIMKTRKAEADGIKLVAEARNYEMEKAKDNLQVYLQLKQIELSTKQMERWNGVLPQWFMGGGGNSPNMLLQMPVVDNKK